MKIAILLLMAAMTAVGQTNTTNHLVPYQGHCVDATVYVVPCPKPQPFDFQNCRMNGGSGNSPKPFDSSIVFQCGTQTVELHGEWHCVVEDGNVYRSELGMPDMNPKPATERDRDFWKWCRVDDRQIKSYDWAPENRNPNATPNKPWYPNPKDYPLCGDDDGAADSYAYGIRLGQLIAHKGKTVTIETPCVEAKNSDEGCSIFPVTDSPIPFTTIEPVTQPVLRCPAGWHVEVWHQAAPDYGGLYALVTPPNKDEYRAYRKPEPVMAGGDGNDKDHPAKCVRDDMRYSDEGNSGKKN